MELYNSYNSIPYLIVLSVLIMLYSIEQHFRTKIISSNCQYIAFALLLVFIGLRGHIYTDYISYYPLYERIPNIFHFSLKTYLGDYFEPGYLLYTSLCKTVIPNYFAWVFINTFIDLAVFLWFFRKYSNSVMLSFVVFFAIQGLGIEVNLFRNVKSIGLFQYLQKRKPYQYFLLNIIGASFHLSSLAYLPCYFFIDKTISKKVLWSLFAIANVMFISQTYITSYFFGNIAALIDSEFVSYKILHRLENAQEGVISIGYFERTIAFILFIGNYHKLQAYKNINLIMCNCFFLYYLTFYMFADFKVIANRLPILFVFSYWILYPNLVRVTRRSSQTFIKYLIIVLCLLKVFIAHRAFTTQYDNLLWGIRSYDERKYVFDKYYNSVY